MDKERLDRQLQFILEIDKEKQVFRQTHLSGHGRRENDAEHAWHMAVAAWLLREYSNEPVDIGHVVLMCLIHDLVEIDAGDTYAYDELPEDQSRELKALFDEFEAWETPEAKFAHAMDNLQPLLLNHSNDGGDWREHGVNRTQILGRQSKTALSSEDLYRVTEEIIRTHVEKGDIIDS